MVYEGDDDEAETPAVPVEPAAMEYLRRCKRRDEVYDAMRGVAEEIAKSLHGDQRRATYLPRSKK